MPDQFFQTPTTFAFNRTTVFYWTDGQGTLLTGLFVRGNTDPTEVKELPLNGTNCGTDASGACVQYVNNGTGTFGGPYADGLVLGHTYHFNIQWTEPDGSLTGNSSSSTFSMINPVVSSASQLSTSSSSISTSIPASATSALPTSTSASTTATGAAETQSPASITSSKGLSTGAKAGIAVGATLAGLVLLLLGIFLFCRRPSRARKPAGEDMVQKNPDLGGFYGSGSRSQGSELPADVPQTLNAQELDGTPAAAWETSKLHSPFSSPGESGTQGRASMSDGLRAGPSQPSPGASFFAGGVMRETDMTAAQLAQLEEEERRIDDAIRESERLVELRAQREAVQNRIRMAKGNTAGHS